MGNRDGGSGAAAHSGRLAARTAAQKSAGEGKWWNARGRTDLYRALYPVLRTANRCCVDRVLIRRDEVRIVLFKPMNSVYRFVFEERGFDRVNDPKVLKAASHWRFPRIWDHLRDNRCYSFSVRQDITAQGDKVHWYEYNILPYYKDTLTKAWYHQPEVEDGIIR